MTFGEIFVDGFKRYNQKNIRVLVFFLGIGNIEGFFFFFHSLSVAIKIQLGLMNEVERRTHEADGMN